MNKVIYHNTPYYGRSTTIIIADGYGYVMVSQMNGNEAVAAIHNLHVHESRRREGLGNILLEEACEEAQNMGAVLIRLSTASGTWMEDWYQRHGFRAVGKDAEVKNCTVLEKYCNSEQ